MILFAVLFVNLFITSQKMAVSAHILLYIAATAILFLYFALHIALIGNFTIKSKEVLYHENVLGSPPAGGLSR